MTAHSSSTSSNVDSPTGKEDSDSEKEAVPGVLPFYSHTSGFSSASAATAARWGALGVRPAEFSNLFEIADGSLRLAPLHGVYRGAEQAAAGDAAGDAAANEGDEEEFRSTEHYFQMCKYGEAHRNLMRELSARDVAAYGQRRLKVQQKHLKLRDTLRQANPALVLPADSELVVGQKVSPVLEVSDWHDPLPGQRVWAMWHALRAKFGTGERRDMLLSTRGAWLVEHTRNDKAWGDGLDGTGTNFLGKLLVLLRTELDGAATLQAVESVLDDATFMGAPMNVFLQYE
jgi:predicted NAD-dependent protein-ADP-ribosyltransferase YbiA (DUF1768 family)